MEIGIDGGICTYSGALGVLAGDTILPARDLRVLKAAVVRKVIVLDYVKITPDLIDLMIALAGGAAGAYATISPRLNVAFVGVAIATALVPPLASSGIICSTEKPVHIRLTKRRYFGGCYVRKTHQSV